MKGFKNIKKKFSITNRQEIKINNFLKELINYNKHTNLVGRSTLEDPWRSHILDCIQIVPFIKNSNNSIIDLGTGAGLPGIILAIMGCKNVHLVDSSLKKINFLKLITLKLNINAKLHRSRIENLKVKKYDYITSRALANLEKLLTYSHNFINKNSVLIFLKGKKVNEEIDSAKKYWNFDNEVYKSYSDDRGNILIIKNLTKKT